MPVKKYKKNHAGRRFMSVDTFSDITKTKPEKSLIVFRKQKAGRSKGKITVRHRGGGARRFIRLIDFKQMRYDEVATVIAIEYDPNRNARIALIQFEDGEKRYILAPDCLTVDMKVVSSAKAIDATVGARMPIEFIPIGSFVHNIEFRPGGGGQIARGAGTQVQLMGIEGKYAQLKMPSGEIRKVLKDCSASVGMVSNPDHRLIRWGKAGRMRHKGFRPTVRGKAMNPCDHPHGGGEGKHPIGMKAPKTPWGKKALGVRTRNKKKVSSKLIVKRRPKKRKKK